MWASVFLTNALKWKLTPRTVRFLYREISCSIHSTNFRLKDGPISQAVSTLIQQYFLSRSLTFCRGSNLMICQFISYVHFFSPRFSMSFRSLSLRPLRPNKLFRTMIIENDDILLKKWHDKLIHFPYTRCTLIHKHIHKIMCSMCAMCLNFRIWRCQKNRYGSGRRPSDVAVVAVAVKWEWVWRMEQRMDNGRSVKYLLNLFFHAWQNICIHLSCRSDIHLIHSSFDYAIDRYTHTNAVTFVSWWHIEYAKKKRQ